MTYEEFEWNILKLAYEDGLERLKPSFLAYALGLPHETVSSYLERATHAGLLEMDVTDDGRLEYFIPGVDKSSALPRPLWKDEFDEEAIRAFNEAEASAGGRVDDLPAPADVSSERDGAIVRPEPQTPQQLPRDGFVTAEGEPDGAVGGRPGPVVSSEPTDGALGRSAPSYGARSRPERPSNPPRQSQALVVRAPQRSHLPAALRAHIEERYGSEDGTVTGLARRGSVAVLDRQASVTDADDVVVEGQLVKADNNLPLRIESADDAFTDPSQTIFMRQLKVYGVKSEAALREHVERLFTSFGYQAVAVGGERMRFERGSVTFILALVPLFVLVLPLFVYLFLYCMGRSTIQQEPVELDVQFRKLAGDEGTYEIDLTFIGMHGVVLGAADQRVLNQEVDTLRDELQWSLSTA